MSIENPNMDNTPEKANPSKEQKDNFSEAEQKLLDDYSKSNKGERIDPSNMEAETNKVWWTARRSDFFEKNYKTISKNPDKYPKIYPLLQTFLKNNKQNIDKAFQERIDLMKQQTFLAERKFIEEMVNSPAMTSWLERHPEQSTRDAWEHFNDITWNKILERVNNEERKKFFVYPNIVKRVVNELYYAAEDNIQKNQTTEETKKWLKTVNLLLSSFSEQNPEFYKPFEAIHKNTKDYLLTINNQEITTDMKSNVDIGIYDKALKDFVTIAKQKTQDPTALQDAVITIQPILQNLYDQWLADYTKAKENNDPLKRMELFMDAESKLKKLTDLKRKSEFNFWAFEWTYSNTQTDMNISLAQGLLDDITYISSNTNVVPALYEIWYKLYGEALIETDLDAKKEKYETCKKYFEKIIEKKPEGKNYSQKANDLFVDSENKLQNINDFLEWESMKLGNSDVFIETVDIASLPIYCKPNPFNPGINDVLSVAVGENKQQFDTINIIDATGKLVAIYENGKNIFPSPDTRSKYKDKESESIVQFDLPLRDLWLSSGMYFITLSSKTTQITKTEKIIVVK